MVPGDRDALEMRRKRFDQLPVIGIFYKSLPCIVQFEQAEMGGARLAALDAIERAAIDMGILDQARRNAQAAIQGLLENLGINSVTVVSAAGKT
jgi:hypothetical protein